MAAPLVRLEKAFALDAKSGPDIDGIEARFVFVPERSTGLLLVGLLGIGPHTAAGRVLG